MRQPQVILVVTLAVLGVLAAALPLGKGDDVVDDAAAGGVRRLWPCCDNCGVCNRKNPPDCECLDISLTGCHPRCKQCVMTFVGSADDDDGGKRPAGAGGPGPIATFRCADILTNFCRRRCTRRAPAAAAILQLGDEAL